VPTVDSGRSRSSSPRISARIATTCPTILIFPSDEAGMTIPRAYAMLRSVVTASSRPMMMATIQAGASPIWMSEMNAADVSSLSAIGSIICPSASPVCGAAPDSRRASP
jgi:hypothetical protein